MTSSQTAQAMSQPPTGSVRDRRAGRPCARPSRGRPARGCRRCRRRSRRLLVASRNDQDGPGRLRERDHEEEEADEPGLLEVVREDGGVRTGSGDAAADGQASPGRGVRPAARPGACRRRLVGGGQLTAQDGGAQLGDALLVLGGTRRRAVRRTAARSGWPPAPGGTAGTATPASPRTRSRRWKPWASSPSIDDSPPLDVRRSVRTVATVLTLGGSAPRVGRLARG